MNWTRRARDPTKHPSMTDPDMHPPSHPRMTGWPDLNWPLLICGYFAVQVAWRRLLGGGLALDEAEILLWSRHLALGYGPQPPLYSWLQWVFLSLVPDPLLALSLLKNLLLATIYVATYRLLRTAHPPRIAGPAALALFLIPQISWDSQRDLTHSILALALAAGTALVFWSGALMGRRGGWAAFGVLTGLGLLAKPNFLVVPAALLLAAASLPPLRARIAPIGLLLAVVLAAAIAAAPAHWALTHPEIAFASVSKLHLAGTGRLGTALRGLAALLHALAETLLLATLILGGMFLLYRRPTIRQPATPLETLLLRAILAGLCLTVLSLLLTGTTNVRPIWLLPVIFLAAPLAAARLVVATGAPGSRALLRTIATLAGVVFLALAVNIRYGEPGNPALNRAPVAEIAARLPPADLLVAEPAWLAGSLVYARPDLPVLSADAPGPPPPPSARVVALWWDGDRSEKITSALARAWGTPTRVGTPLRLSAPFALQPAEPFDVDVAEVSR